MIFLEIDENIKTNLDLSNAYLVKIERSDNFILMAVKDVFLLNQYLFNERIQESIKGASYHFIFKATDNEADFLSFSDEIFKPDLSIKSIKTFSINGEFDRSLLESALKRELNATLFISS